MDNEALASRPESPKKKIKSNPAENSEAEPSNSSGNTDVTLYYFIDCAFIYNKQMLYVFLQKSSSFHNCGYIMYYA